MKMMTVMLIGIMFRNQARVPSFQRRLIPLLQT